MKITLLDSKEAKEETHINVRSFLTSSRSSPAFPSSQMRNFGITIVLPPNSSRKFKFHQSPASNEASSTVVKKSQLPAISLAAHSLIMEGITRNRFLLRDYSPLSVESNRRRNLNSEVIPHIPSMESYFKAESSIKHGDFKLNKTSCLKNTSMEDATSSWNSQTEKPAVTKQMVLRGNITKQKRILRRAAYIDVCLNSGKVTNALSYASKGLQFFPNVPSRNVVLEPLFCHAAHEKNLVAVTHALILANKYKAPLSASSYIVVFEMLATMPQTKEISDIARTLVQNMKKENVTVDDLITGCNGRQVLIERVLKSIQSTGLLNDKPPQSSNFKYPIEDKAKSYHSPGKGLQSVGSPEELINEQISIHSKFVYKLRNIACTLSESEINELIATQSEVENNWRESLIAGFQRSLNGLKSDKAGYQLMTFLECLPAETFADIIIQEIHNRIDDSDKQSIGFIFAQVALGRKVQELYHVEVMKKYGLEIKAKEAHIEYCRKYFNPDSCPSGPSNPREVWDSVVNDMEYNDNSTNFLLREWYYELYCKIGKFLYDILLKDVKIDENIGVDGAKPHMVPALYVVFRKSTKGYQRQLKMHPAVHRVFPNKLQPFLEMDPFDLPMVCPPRPWISGSNGVYPLSTPPFQR